MYDCRYGINATVGSTSEWSLSARFSPLSGPFHLTRFSVHVEHPSGMLDALTHLTLTDFPEGMKHIR